MHIVKKILSEIEQPLQNRFSVYIDKNDWKLFTEPLTDNTGNIDINRFLKRQKKSIKIIKQILGYHGKEEIVGYLAELASIEPKIQELQPWVRDHVVHAINTFILGAYILEKVKMPGTHDLRFGYPFAWKLCGPTHDLGYPLEMARNIQNPFVKKMNRFLVNLNSPSPKIAVGIYPQNLNKLCNDIDSNDLIQDRITEWALGINVNDYYDWLNQKNITDHGVISAHAQIKVLDAMYQKVNPNRKSREIYKNGLNFNQKNFSQDIITASSALFIHNIDLKYYGFSNKINFELSPLAFLLFLCDSFQEWDRYSKNREVFSGNDFDIKCFNCSIELSVPDEIGNKIFPALCKRLSGLTVKVNGRVAVN